MPCGTPDIYQFEDVAEQKKFLRKRARTALKDFCADGELMKECSKSALKSLCESDEFKNAPLVLGYMPMFDELDVRPILENALEGGKQVALPRMRRVDSNGEKLIDFFYINALSDALDDANCFSIKEPREDLQIIEPPLVPENTLVLVPGLAFNLEGARLGRGMGDYDRFLARLPADRKIVLCGCCFTICVTKGIPLSENDFFVDHLLTEYGLVEARSAARL